MSGAQSGADSSLISKSVLFLFPPPQMTEGVGLGLKKDTGDLVSIFGRDRRAPTSHLLQQKIDLCRLWRVSSGSDCVLILSLMSVGSIQLFSIDEEMEAQRG